MPIVICPKCKKRFNDIATYCPSCGYPTKKAEALAKAMIYLKSSAYSYRGLKKQLEDCGYTESQAQYGAHSCGANWYEQAIKSAKMHLRSEPFSYDGLYEQLIGDGFLHNEATWGVDNCEGNWEEQAVKYAKAILFLSIN